MKAILLAGGLGTRIREETEFRPKPMVEVGGRPILWHIMKNLAHFGITDFIIATGYKSDMIKEYFLNYEAWNNDFTVTLGQRDSLTFHGAHDEASWNVTVAFTGEETMTGGRVHRAARYLDDQPFLVTYGDGLGVPVDDAEAFKWYQAAANEGDPRAHFNLGSFYIAGRGTPIDGPKANEHWFEAALRGMHLAQVRLALSFARGDGGKVDHQLAFVWAYVAKDKDANARIILDAVTQAISAEEVAALEREAHGVMHEMKSIDPNDKRRFSQGI